MTNIFCHWIQRKHLGKTPLRYLSVLSQWAHPTLTLTSLHKMKLTEFPVIHCIDPPDYSGHNPNSDLCMNFTLILTSYNHFWPALKRWCHLLIMIWIRYCTKLNLVYRSYSNKNDGNWNYFDLNMTCVVGWGFSQHGKSLSLVDNTNLSRQDNYYTFYHLPLINCEYIVKKR